MNDASISLLEDLNVPHLKWQDITVRNPYFVADCPECKTVQLVKNMPPRLENDAANPLIFNHHCVACGIKFRVKAYTERVDEENHG